MLAFRSRPGNDELRSLALELNRFAERIERLPDVMKAKGVDDDVIEILGLSIDTQICQLQALPAP